MTDERIGNLLWDAVDRLPPGSGIVLRHYSLPPQARQDLALRLAQMAEQRGIMLAIGTDAALAERVGARFVHNPAPAGAQLAFSRSVHGLEEAAAARREGATLVFVSPVYATRSHPGHKTLGPELAAQIARTAGVPAIALGGMDEEKFALLEREHFYGWAGIDAWLRI